MHPSFSVNLEPGLDRGVPWGCDLYTFVTSAAGHMMRTLQKPRKNRPSKRQVNHRRFLHNMIQRKFADIEAANHRLASALYPKEEENNASVLAAEERDAVDRPDGSSPDAAGKSSGRPAEAAASTCSDALFNAGDHGPSVKKDSKITKSQTVACSAAQKREKETDEPVELTPTSFQRRPRPAGRPHNGPPEPVRNIPGDSQVAQPDSDVTEFLQDVDADPSVSPGLGLLPPESRDLSVQMFPGASTCAQGQKNIADMAESQWSEIMDLLGVGSDDGGYAEVEAFLESMCASRGDAGPDVEPAGFGFVDASDSFAEKTASEGGRSHGATCEYAREDGRGGQEPTQSQNGGSFQAGLGVAEQQLPAALSYQSCCMLGNDPNFTPFQGVAQSFTVPPHYHKPRAIPTPPREEEWPFTDILEDRTSVYG